MESKRNYFRLVNDKEIEEIRNAAIKILCKYGFSIQNIAILKMVEKKGLKVDYSTLKVEVTPDVFYQLEEAAKRSSEKEKSSELLLRRPLSSGNYIGRNIAQYYDWRTGAKRSAVLQDNIDIMKAGQMLPQIVSVAPLFTATDISCMIEPIVGFAQALKISDKPFSGIEMMMGEQLPYLEELDTIKTNKQVHYNSSFASITRFTLDNRAASCLESVWRRNGLTGSWGTNSTPLLGMNAPVTVAGAAALAMAEMIGGWIAGWALNEDVRLGVIPVSGSMDMQTTRILFNTPQSILTDALLYQIFDKLYGIDTLPEVSATFVDGKVPGMQTIHDKMFKSMSLFTLTGCPIGPNFGMLYSGSSICPAQMILDFELNRELEQLTKGVTVNQDTLCLDTILEVGPCGDFIMTDHTIDNYKEHLWKSTLFDSTGFKDSVTESNADFNVLQKAQDIYDNAIRSYKPLNIEDYKLNAIDDVITRAKIDLLNMR